MKFTGETSILSEKFNDWEINQECNQKIHSIVNGNSSLKKMKLKNEIDELLTAKKISN
jgi:hypothetical protein